MAGYSETPLPRKLGIKDGDRLALLDAPAGFDVTLGELPRVGTVPTDARAKVCAIDETWSGLRLVHRVADRRR